MKDFLEYIVKELVDNTLDVSVKVTESEDKTVYELKVDEKDLGKVIGKRGKNADAIRTLITAISAKNGKKAVLKIVE